MPNIYMVNTPEFPTPITHYYTTSKFMNGFAYNGYSTAEINSHNSFYNISDSQDNIFVVCDIFYPSRKENWMDLLNQLAKKFEQSTWIFWHFHSIYKNDYLSAGIEFPFKKYIFTGEYYRNITDDVRSHWGGLIDWYTSHENYVNLPFSADINPNDIDSFFLKRKDIYDCGYVGARYKEQWTNQLANKYNCFIHYYWPSLDEQQRIDKGFLSSKISLGFNSDSNAKLGLPTERVFEGLAFGCVVVSDCKVAEEATDGIVKFVDSYDELDDFVTRCLGDPVFIQEKQKLGVDYAKEKGTYFHVAKNFIKKIEEIN